MLNMNYGKMAATLSLQIVQITGFSDPERETLIRLLGELPCVFIDSEKFENCTHLIAKRPSRSEKWLAACAAGKWVLTKEYVINSAESGRWLDETTFEWGYKMEKDAHYSPQMQSAPKRWREHLTRTGALGAFSRWKVTLLIEKADKEREAFLRVLTAGHAVIHDPASPDGEITHLFTNNKRFLQDKEDRDHSAPYHSVLYVGNYLLEDTINGTPGDMTEEQIAELKSSVWKRVCLAQASLHRFTEKFNGHFEKPKLKGEVGRTSLNRIEELIEGQFFTEAFWEIGRLTPLVLLPHFFELLLKHFIQGNVDIQIFGQFSDILSNLLHHCPPWESTQMVQYYLTVLQCPVCKKGTWSFIETLTRCFLEDRFCLCHETSDMEIDSHKRRKIVATMLKFLSSVMQEEVKALSKKLCEQTDFSRKTLFPSFIVGIFWPKTRTMVFLTKNISALTDLLIKCHVDKKALSPEMMVHLNGMFTAVVEYWILLGFYLNKNLLYQVANDFVFYICISCEEFTIEEKKQFVSSIASPWLQMLVAEGIFKNLYAESNIQMSNEPLCLQKLISTYIPMLWKAVACGDEKVQKLRRKRNIGQRPCLESQRALLMLNDENQNQGDVLLDLPIVENLRGRRKTMQASSCIQMPRSSQESRSGQDTRGETAMHKACRSNNVKKLQVQLSIPGNDINAKDNAGWTPLHEACNHGSAECVREILQRCPEVDLLSHVDGVTPLHDALQNGHVEIGKMLLQHGGAIILKQQDSDGKFPLDFISSAQLKNELFEIIQVEETIEDFHKNAIQLFDEQKLEFSAFLLLRMLFSFMSAYGLPSDTVTAKSLYPNPALLAGHVKSTRPSFSSSVVICYLEALATMQNLGDFLQSIPEYLHENPGFNMQVLFSVLYTLASSSPRFKT